MKRSYIILLFSFTLFLYGCQHQKIIDFNFYGSWYGNIILHAWKNQIPVYFKDQWTYGMWGLKDLSYYVTWSIIDDIQSGIIKKDFYFRNYKPNSWIETLTVEPTEYSYMSWFLYHFTFPKLGIKIWLEDASSSYFDSNGPYFSERNLFYKYNKISISSPNSILFLYVFPKDPSKTFEETIEQDHKFFFTHWYRIVPSSQITWRDMCKRSLINSWATEVFILQPKNWWLEDNERLLRFWNPDLIFILDKKHPDRYYMTSFINLLTCQKEITIEFF